jgi:hypothetical protein
MAETAAEAIPRSVAVEEVRKAAAHFSDLYFHFSKILIEELGHDRGKELIVKAIQSRARDRAKKIIAKAESLGIERKRENYLKVTEIPFLGWDPARGNKKCAYAAAWLDHYETDPWFKEFAPLYCTTNDPLICELFTGTTTQKITKNVLWGHDTCEREYYPIGQVPGDDGSAPADRG